MPTIIQGLNLESEITLIKFKLEGNNTEDIAKLLDEVSSFHPIFIQKYSLTPTLLSINSRLPFLWRECDEIFKKLSKNEIDYKQVRDLLLNQIIAKRIKSMSTIPLLYSAHKKGLETTPAVLEKIVFKTLQQGYRNVFNRYYVIGCGKGSQVTASISSSKDAYFAQNVQRDKWSTNVMIERLGLPIPKWSIIATEKELEKIFPDYKKPIIIKPTGLTGGRGVSVGINSLQEAKKAFRTANNIGPNRAPWQVKVMIQEQVFGDDYRLLVIDGKLEIVTKRIPAFVEGDGKNTIENLINEINKNPRRDISNPSHILKPIIIDTPLKELLTQQGLTLDSIPKKGEIVPVREVASMSQGGITEDCTDIVGKEIKTIVETLAQSVHAFVLGVDIICQDISKPLTKENGGIIEINTMPESYLNLFPVIGKQREYVSDIYIDRLLAQNNCKQYVLVGQLKDDLPTLLRKKKIINNTDTVGEIIEDRYYIDGILINKGLERWRATEGIKCNGSLDAIILHFRDWNEVREYGLGFDHIHTLFISNEQSKDKKCMKIVRKYKREKYIDKFKII
ncbi:hypothetical protein GX888_02320 [Candidatus Dojkabacteria bacterium]|uniref:ATP-grasp domain-containing protein n=1 Tax=Candidatus Dojkabacteria bacterium TaxID=2099670 RepID=A0A847VDC6_9BACT|nr:hypothetical protein [Candidatus Dojkabacteria bacterium]